LHVGDHNRRCGAAVKKPNLKHTLIVGLTFCAALFAVEPIVTTQRNPFVLVFTILSVIVASKDLTSQIALSESEMVCKLCAPVENCANRKTSL
jgi:hypothetical protein